MQDAGGTTLASRSFPASTSDVSFNLQPELDPNGTLVTHTTLAAASSSPGALADGSLYGSGVVEPTGLVINEVQAWPTVDHNCDGTMGPTTDEFVEIVNSGSTPVDMSGITLSDEVAVRHTFDAFVLQPHEAVVLWGGGNPSCPMPSGVVQRTGYGLGLNGQGETVTLRRPDGMVIDSMPFTTVPGHAVVRSPEGDRTAAVVDHTSIVSAVASPGTRANGTVF